MTKPTKDEAARDLAQWHLDCDSRTREVYRFVSPNEDETDEPIKLLDVVDDPLMVDDLLVFAFGATADMPYRCELGTVSAADFPRVQSGEISLPAGWNIGAATPFRRNGSGVA